MRNLTNQKTTLILKVVLLVFLLPGLLSACGKSNENDTAKVSIGIINLTSVLNPVADGFKAGMEEHGYTEAENVTYIYDGPIGDIEGLNAAAQKLVDAGVDMIFSLSTPATMAAQSTTAGTSIPVIFGTVTDPVAVGLVDDLTRFEGNLTGVMTGGSEPKSLEWLQTVVPELKRVYIPYNPDDASSSSALNNVMKVADEFGIEIVSAETRDRDAVLAALQTIPDDIDGILLLPDSIVTAQLDDIVAFTLERKIPLVGINKEHVEAGALLAYGFDFFEVGRQAAGLAQQVLAGVPLTELPIQSAEFYLSVNLQTASSIDITIHENTLAAAQTIIR
jgi:putative ABC transport system substrate-binding protein